MIKIILTLLTVGLTSSAFANSPVAPNIVTMVQDYFAEKGVQDWNSGELLPSQLTGEAKKQFDKLQADIYCEEGSFCPEAYTVLVDGYPVVVVYLTDGGSQWEYIYTSDGDLIASGSASESDFAINWD